MLVLIVAYFIKTAIILIMFITVNVSVSVTSKIARKTVCQKLTASCISCLPITVGMYTVS